MMVTALAFFVSAPASEAAGGSWGGDGTTAATAFTIDDAADLALLATNVNSGINYNGVFFKLTADIDLLGWDHGDGFGWMPIGDHSNPFAGKFDGSGYAILNMTINNRATHYVGLFGCLNTGGEIKNLGIAGGTIAGMSYVGGVVGENYSGTVENCYNAGAVNGNYDVGGVVGYNGGTVENCYNGGTVDGNDNVGGVVGYISSGSVTDCYNIGAVNGGGSSVGGVIGYNYSGGSVTDCYNTGAVTADGNSVGGVIGYNYGTVEYCYNTGAVTSDDNAVGGVVGINRDTVDNCYNTGVANGNFQVGGVVGYNYSGSVTDCYSTGAVTGVGNAVGGVVGWNNVIVTNCYSTGAVTCAGGAVGGAVGRNDGTLTNCYYNTDYYLGGGVGAGTGTGTATGQTTIQMTAAPFLISINGIGSAFDKPPYGASSGCATSFYPELKVFTLYPTGSFTRETSKISAVATASCTLGENEDYFTSGDGTISDPYKIYTAKQLNHVRQHLTGEYFELMNDISLDGWNATATGATDQTDGNGWVPIGDDTTMFTGIFDGNGHVISNLIIDRATSDYIGLFGVVFVGTIENLGITGGTVSGDSKVGSVVGWNGGRVKNCYNIGTTVNGNNEVGGVVGWNIMAVENCYNTGEVNGTGNNVGGVTGDNDYTAENCYNTGAVNGNFYVGGVTGDNDGTVENCYNTGKVNGTGNCAGGVVGWNSDTIMNCYSVGAVIGAGNAVGGVAGCNVGTLTNCYYNTDHYSDAGVGAGTDTTTGQTTAQMTDGAFLSSINGAGSAFVMPAYGLTGGCQEEFYPELNVFVSGTVFDQAMSKASVFAYACTLGENEAYFTSGDGTIGTPYQIYTAKQLNHVRQHLTGDYFELMNDIDLSGWNAAPSGAGITPQTDGNGWVPIGDDTTPFTGIFDGGNYKIQNLTIDRTADYNVGLFGYINGGTVKDLSIYGGTVAGYEFVGGVVGYNGGTVENCYNLGTTVNGDYEVGGVVGYNGGTVENCYNLGTVNGTNGNAGGVIGYNAVNVSNCYNAGAVNGDYGVGGVVGENDGSLTNCYNTGAVSGTNSYVGGVAGVNNNTGTVANCYNAGAVTGAGSVGGMVGYNAGTVTDCYYDIDNCSDFGIGEGVDSGLYSGGLSTAHMTDANVLTTGDMSGLGAAFGKRPTNTVTNFCYYPELLVFMGPPADPAVQAASEASVEVARRTPIFNGATGNYGYQLSDSALDAEFEDPVTGVDVEGTVSWASGTTLLYLSDGGVTVYNYDFTPDYTDLYISITSASTTIAVDPAMLTVTPDSGQGKIVGQTDPVLTYTVSGWKFADTDALMTNLLERIPGEGVGTYAYDLGFLSAGSNYILALASGEVFTISPASAGGYYINASSDVTSTISPTGRTTVPGGGNMTFSFSASAGFHVSSVTVDGIDLTLEQIRTGSYTFVNVNSNHTISVKSVAGLSATDLTLSITVAKGQGYAEYSINGSSFVRYTEAVVIPMNADLVIRAYSDDGYSFEKWEIPTPRGGSQLTFDKLGTSLYLQVFFAEDSSSITDHVSDNLLWWAVAAIVILVIIGILIWFVLHRRSKE